MSNLSVSHRMNKLVVIVLIVLLVLVLGLLFWLSPANTQNHNPAQVDSAPINVNHQLTASTITPDQDILRAESLIQGMETSPNGHLKITGKTRQVLDVFLEDSSNGAITIAKDQIYKKMKEPAAMEVITILEHYAAYKKALADMDLSPPQITQQANDDNLLAGVKMQRISALRNEYLSPEIVQVFYANDDENAQYMLARQRIMSISGLTDEQRQEELTALQNQFQKTTVTSEH